MKSAVALMAVDPHALGGLWLKARTGPARDRVVVALLDSLPSVTRLPPGLDDAQLFGGLDIGATLSAGRVVRHSGLLGTGPRAFILPMAERIDEGLAARLALALDDGAAQSFVALDESTDDEPCLSETLRERMGLQLDLEGLAHAATVDLTPGRALIAAARARRAVVVTPDAALASLTRAAFELGVASLRAPLFALAAARASAALRPEATVAEDDLVLATELVLAPRATRFPDLDEVQDPPDDPTPPLPDKASDADAPDEDQPKDLPIPDELLLEAAQALLPADLLARLAAGKAARGAKGQSGTGQKKAGRQRGRPLPSRPGTPDGQSRLDLIATLRAAAPWQTVRRRQTPQARQKVLVRREDLRVRRFEERSDRLLIFTVDASGSAAVARLAEAKGAVELLLAEAYARRDHVALIAFRGTGAELLLPPTRSLVQTKRRLAALPGGGGTPLAAGLRSAMDLAGQSRGRGLTPTIALLSDGKANIALDGRPDRAVAAEDAVAMARAMRAAATESIVIDTGRRPREQLRTLALELDAPYVPLPRADAKRLSSAIGGVLAG